MSSRSIGLALFAVLLWLGACSKDNPPPTQVETPAPNAASDLYAKNTSDSRITLRWRDNSDNEVGFRMQRREASDPAFTTLPDTTAGNHTAYEDRDVEAGKTYTYRVLAYSRGKDSAPSNTVTVQAVANQSPATPLAITPPDGATEVDPATPVLLEWSSQDGDGDPILYELRFGPTLRNMAILDSASAGTSFTLNGPFDRNAHYFWQIVARDPKGVSTPSPVWGFNTEVDRQIIPAGKFFMGADPETDPTSPFLHPGNPVVIDSSYSIDKYEVTNQQYADFLNQMLDRKQLRLVGNGFGLVMDAAGDFVWVEVRPQDLDSDLSFSAADSAFIVADGRENFPVVEVSWYGADAYAHFYGRRLPTEAEWERAARGESRELGFKVFASDSSTVDTVGLGSPLPWGDEPDLNRANVLDSGDPYENQGRVRTTPIGFFDGTPHAGYDTRDGTSPYGVDDMAGNVWEWCDDWHSFYRAPHQPPSTGHFKILRGGGFNKPWGSARTWNRSSVSPQETDRSYGFRTAGAVTP